MKRKKDILYSDRNIISDIGLISIRIMDVYECRSIHLVDMYSPITAKNQMTHHI